MHVSFFARQGLPDQVSPSTEKEVARRWWGPPLFFWEESLHHRFSTSPRVLMLHGRGPLAALLADIRLQGKLDGFWFMWNSLEAPFVNHCSFASFLPP